MSLRDKRVASTHLSPLSIFDTTSEEDPEFQRALEASLKASAIQDRRDVEGAKAYCQRREWSDDIDKLSEDTAKNASVKKTLPEPISPPRETIDDCIRNISISQAQEVPRIVDPGGDTYVWISPPSKQPEQSEIAYKWCQHRYSKPHIMRSEKLSRASPLFREKLESPTYQYRTFRRHGLAGNLPGNISFILDLTPPTEGDDAVYLTASLSCSEGVRYWHEAGNVWKVSNRLVAGNEEHSSPQWYGLASSDMSSLEYSPFRHRSAIERVLAAIQGEMVTIDSAVKLWTTAIVAHFFGITYDSCTYLTDSIVSWLRVEPNFFFLEVNPEVSLRIAAGLENHDLVRDAFAILVGEEALDSLQRNSNTNDTRQFSTFGRKKHDLPEALMDTVEYASKSIVERIIRDFELMVYEDMQWLENLPTIKRLEQFHEPEMKAHIALLKKALRSYERSAILRTLCSHGPDSELPSIGKSEHLLPQKTQREVWLGLMPTQRIFTRMFWRLLKFHRRYELWLPDMVLDSLKQQDPLTQKLDPHELRNRKQAAKTILKMTADGQRTLNRLRPANLASDGNAARPAHIDSVFGSTLPIRQLNDLNLRAAHEISQKKLPVQGKELIMLDEHQNLDEADQVHEQIPSPMPRLHTSRPDDTSKAGQADTSIPGPQCVIAPLGSSVLWDFEEDIAAIDPFGDKTLQTQDTMNHEAGLPGDSYGDNSDQSPTDRLEKSEGTTDSWGGPTSSSLQATPTTLPYPCTPPTDRSELKSPTFFDFYGFCDEANAYISDFAAEKLLPSDATSRKEPYHTTIIGTLTCLQESEWKYLPLWAGGLDDGTGAVYDNDIMETAPDMGFSTAGPSIHTVGSTYSDTGDFDMLSDAGSSNFSFNASTAVLDGHTDQLHRHRTSAASSTLNTEELILEVVRDGEEEAARRQIAAYEAAEAEAAAAAKRERERLRSIDVDSDTLCDDDLESDFDDSDSDGTEKGVDDFDSFDDLEGESHGEDDDGVMV